MATTTTNRVSAARGGRRETSAEARFTAQLVWLDTPETKERVKALAQAHRLSQSAVLRAVGVHGLKGLEAGLSDGSILAETLA